MLARTLKLTLTTLGGLAVALTFIATSAGSASAAPHLGSWWEDVSPGGWYGRWTRRGNSNVFDASWTHPVHGRAAATMTIHQGLNNRFTIVRTDTIGYTRGRRCKYTGTIAANGKRATGHATCDWSPGPHTFEANIHGRGYREFMYPKHPRYPDTMLDTRWRAGTVYNKYPGRDPAIAFCKAKGFSTAVHWDADSLARGRYHKTRFIGSDALCKGTCRPRGFRVIRCR